MACSTLHVGETCLTVRKTLEGKTGSRNTTKRRIRKHSAACLIHEAVPLLGAGLSKPRWRDLHGVAKNQRETARQQQHRILRRSQVEGFEAFSLVINKREKVLSDERISTYRSTNYNEAIVRHFEFVGDRRIGRKGDARWEQQVLLLAVDIDASMPFQCVSRDLEEL